jgi:predicted transcriptional regulator
MQKKSLLALVKFVLIVLSLIFLSIFLSILIKSYQEPIFGANVALVGIIIISLSIGIILLLSIIEVLSINEYRGYFLRRSFNKKGRSYLTLSDIFENENRINILTQILNNPGVHHNELLRNCNLHKGQLQWHIDVLLKNHIIKKEKHGQYTIYLPVLKSYDSEEILIIKSKTSSEILTIIKNKPGINSSEISRILNLSRNTIKYHIDKLSRENLISLIRKGRKIELHPIYS